MLKVDSTQIITYSCLDKKMPLHCSWLGSISIANEVLILRKHARSIFKVVLLNLQLFSCDVVSVGHLAPPISSFTNILSCTEGSPPEVCQQRPPLLALLLTNTLCRS